MDPRVQEFLDRIDREVEARSQEIEAKKAEAERKEREEMLIRVGLYEKVNEYCEEIPPDAVSTGTICKDGKKLFVIWRPKALEVTDDEYAQIVEALEKKEKLKDEINARTDANDGITLGNDSETYTKASSGAQFLRVIAVILWVAGFFMSIKGAYVTVSGYYWDTREFDWSAFFTSALAYLFEGGLVMCFAELLDNIQAIRDMISGCSHFNEKKQ